MSDKPIQRSIREILTNSDQYIIPMYQRNYAWEEGEITQLIQDIIDNLPAKGEEARNYYIGTLVVFQRQDRKSASPLFETIDGQQRLTTLVLLASYLIHRGIALNKIPEGKLCFDSREKSSYTLNLLLAIHYKDHLEELMDLKKTNHSILNGYRLIQKNLQNRDGKELQEFADYLFDHVQIIRVKVPDDTDLNHYFEIINNRGEQLEKHEILKANLLAELQKIDAPDDKKSAKQCFHAVWEACSNMEKYVQMGFSTELRSKIFGSEWTSFVPKNYPDLAECFKTEESQEQQNKHQSTSLENIVNSAKNFIDYKESNVGDDSPERFHPTVNFPNFLLHVLRVLTRENLSLDDKKLVPTFEEYLIDHGPEKIKEFTYALLRCKWLFDHYIIKRDFADGTGDWSLKRLKKSTEQNSSYYRNTFEDNSENHRILMLLSAFHVSTPTMAYKHWLNAALHYLLQNQDIVEPKAYLAYLEEVARAFVFDRHLAATDKKDYYEIIYQNHGKCHAREDLIPSKSLEPLLSFGSIENNLIFNYLDYLLWLKHKNENCKKVMDFKFTFRSSVEHYYPQNPENIPRLNVADLNAFGNLCLISHGKNSRLSNFPPEAKKSHYQGENIPIDSMKQYLMMEDTPLWTVEKIQDHTTKMIKTLLAGIK